MFGRNVNPQPWFEGFRFGYWYSRKKVQAMKKTFICHIGFGFGGNVCCPFCRLFWNSQFKENEKEFQGVNFSFGFTRTIDCLFKEFFRKSSSRKMKRTFSRNSCFGFTTKLTCRFQWHLLKVKIQGKWKGLPTVNFRFGFTRNVDCVFHDFFGKSSSRKMKRTLMCHFVFGFKTRVYCPFHWHVLKVEIQGKWKRLSTVNFSSGFTRKV